MYLAWVTADIPTQALRRTKQSHRDWVYKRGSEQKTARQSASWLATAQWRSSVVEKKIQSTWPAGKLQNKSDTLSK